MTLRRNPRSGPRLGGQYRARHRDYSVQHARELFVDALSDSAPELYEDLMDEVYPRYQVAREATKELLPAATVRALWSRLARGRVGGGVDPRGPQQEVRKYGPRVTGATPIPADDRPLVPEWASWSFEDGDWSDHHLTKSPELRELRDTLLAWTGRYPRLEVAWMLDVALDTLVNIDHGRDMGRFAPPRFTDLAAGPWFVFPIPGTPSKAERRDALLEAIPDLGGDLEGRRAEIGNAAQAYFGRPPTFEHPPWHPQWKTEDLYSAEVLEAYRERHPHRAIPDDEWNSLKRDLRQYIKKRKEWAADTGFERSPRRNAELETDEEGVRAFRRLARYCAGDGPSRIAEREGVSTTAVEQSNRSTAHLIGLP